jgi:glycosyltransferase involved in cell wall biosynthesis
MENMDKYSVIIPTLWKSDRTKQLLLDLTVSEYVNEIIIIDNTLTYVSDESIGKIRTISFGENIYVNPAWNCGVSLAKNEHISICNDDIIFNPNIFGLIAHTKVDGIIGQCSNNFNKPHNNNPKITPMNQPRPWGWGTLLLTQKKYWIPIPDQLKIWYGDDFIINKNPCKKLILENFEISTIMSTTSDLPEFHPIKQNDGLEWMKLIQK